MANCLRLAARGRGARRGRHGGVGVFFGGAAAAPGWHLANQHSVEETADEPWLCCCWKVYGQRMCVQPGVSQLPAPSGWMLNLSVVLSLLPGSGCG